MSYSSKEKIKALKKLAARSRSTLCALEGKGQIEKGLRVMLLTEGLVSKSQKDALQLTEEGRRYLKRGLCDRGDEPYQVQHRELHKKEAEDGRDIRINSVESPLSRLYHHKGRAGKSLIDHTQFLAGERLRADFEASQITPKTSVHLTPRVDGGYNPDQLKNVSEIVLEARRRFDHAMTFVGKEMNSLLVDVCCFLKGLELVERERQWPRRSAKIVLRLALDRLAEHYGLSKEAQGPTKSSARGVKVWQASFD